MSALHSFFRAATAAVLSIHGICAVAACIEPKTTKELNELFADAKRPPPDEVCLPGIWRDIDSSVEAIHLLGDVAPKYRRNGEAGGYMQFEPEALFAPMLEAARDLLVGDGVRQGIARTEALLQSREEKLRALRADPAKAADVEELESQQRRIRRAFVEQLTQGLPPGPLEGLIETMSGDAWRLDSTFTPLNWTPNDDIVARTKKSPPKVPSLVVASVHTHPARDEQDTEAAIPSPYDIVWAADPAKLAQSILELVFIRNLLDIWHGPHYIGSFVYPDLPSTAPRRMTWLKPSAYLDARAPSSELANMGPMSLCTVLGATELSGTRRGPSPYEAYQFARRQCSAWLAEKRGLAFYESVGAGAPFKRITFTPDFWAARLVSVPTEEVDRDTKLVDGEQLYLPLLMFVGYIDGLMRVGEGPGNLPEQRQWEVLVELWKRYIWDGIGDDAGFNQPQMQQLLLAIMSRNNFHNQARGDGAMVCASKAKADERRRCLEVRPASRPGAGRDPLGGRSFMIVVGDFKPGVQAFNGQPEMQPQGEVVGYLMSFNSTRFGYPVWGRPAVSPFIRLAK